MEQEAKLDMLENAWKQAMGTSSECKWTKKSKEEVMDLSEECSILQEKRIKPCLLGQITFKLDNSRKSSKVIKYELF